MEYHSIIENHNEGYINENERNVHVWCSKLAALRDKTAGEHGLLLFAGFYNHNKVTAEMLYHWVQIIAKETNATFILVAGQDPRIIIKKHSSMRLISYETLIQEGEAKILRKDDRSVVHGHYYIFSPDKSALRLSINILIGASSSGQLKPEKPNKRDSRFKKAIRMRDKRCAITQSPVPFRDRGPDFTSFQAAHIYPFSCLAKKTYQDFLDLENQPIFRLPQLGDGKPNGVLMFSDLHMLFDAYAFGILVDTSGKIPIYKTYCFEKSNMDLVDKYPELKFNDQVEHPMANFFWEQFKLCLLASFAGNGRVFTT
ncbi:hypothetical protein CPB84DRAFT_1796076 [Gymnopilus junonius]|uniref:HNH nuclease domain-containing protein n=1 Tax=Gymnopilus junonius TaxID=109634 RepID=A0A9P5THL2_GYMJU|nr:hypothetical protein CPB84DRAFT_1796076 [Gymnopilus junonius]